MSKKTDLKGKMVNNSWIPGMSLRNANGQVDPSSLGYQYAIDTTTFIRTSVIEQKFYVVKPSDFIPVEVGTGAWLEEIRQNLTYDLAGDFEDGIQNVGEGNTEVPMVSTALSNKNAKIITWTKGYTWAISEVEKALASNNWDVVKSKLNALKRNWDLGIQRTAFIGSRSLQTLVPGLISNADVTVNTSIIDDDISAMDANAFQTFVKAILSAYYTNSNFTQPAPDTFLMPADDFLGMGVAASSGFPNVTKLEYLQRMFAMITGNANFQIKPLAYCQKVNNAGFLSANGNQRYVLYKKDPDVLRMTIPVDFATTAPGTADNFYWKGIGYGQYTGAIIYRPPEVLYFDNINK